MQFNNILIVQGLVSLHVLTVVDASTPRFLPILNFLG